MSMFSPAERTQLYCQAAFIGPSGAGKTLGALLFAYGITGDWSQIALVDTEHNRSKVYVGQTHYGVTIGNFLHAELQPPYTVEKFENALDEAIKAGLKFIIFDSFSHEWEGVGGITDWANDLGGEFRHWKQPKTAHKRLIDKIMHSPIHVITTIRTKQEYAIIPGGGKNGKSSVEKLGMKPVQSGDIDYEFLIALTFDMDHEAHATKDNTGLFEGLHDMITPKYGEMLRDWLVEGKPVKSVSEEKAEAEAERQKLVVYFREVRQKNEAWFTNKEIKANRKLDDWDLDSLQKLYAAINKPKETPKEETPKEPEKPKTDGNMYIETIAEMIETNEKCKALYEEYLTKMKTTVDKLKPAQLKVLYNMLEVKHKGA